MKSFASLFAFCLLALVLSGCAVSTDYPNDREASDYGWHDEEAGEVCVGAWCSCPSE